MPGNNALLLYVRRRSDALLHCFQTKYTKVLQDIKVVGDALLCCVRAGSDALLKEICADNGPLLCDPRAEKTYFQRVPGSGRMRFSVLPDLMNMCPCGVPRTNATGLCIYSWPEAPFSCLVRKLHAKIFYVIPNLQKPSQSGIGINALRSVSLKKNLNYYDPNYHCTKGNRNVMN